MLGMSAFTITSDGSDIAFAANGTAVLVDSNSVYSLNTVTGAVALLFQDSALQADMSPVFHVGAAFVASLGGGKLFVFDVNGTDDVFFYQNLSTPRVLYDEDFSSSFNAGRGDLASLPAFVVLDVDANGAVQPLTDGLLVLRHLFGFTDSTLIGGALGAGCSRCVAADITSYLNGIAAQLNIDGNPSLTPLTDGLLVLRYKFGFTDTTLTNGAVGPSCTRCDATTIVPYLDCEDLPMFLRSRFDADVEGWTHTGATSMTFGAAGGNPGGYLHIDNSEGPLTFIFAPATFEGDLSALNGGTLAFDGNMLDTGGLDYNNPFEDYGNVRITGGGTSARADLVPGNHTGNGVGNPPKNQWTTFSIGLSAASFGVSPATWSQILADVTEVRLSVEALFGAEVQGVDNFTMAAPGDLCTPMP
jgi:hypothetical protein